MLFTWSIDMLYFVYYKNVSINLPTGANMEVNHKNFVTFRIYEAADIAFWYTTWMAG